MRLMTGSSDRQPYFEVYNPIDLSSDTLSASSMTSDALSQSVCKTLLYNCQNMVV